MSQVKDIISGPAKEVVTNNALASSYGLVTRIDEKENVCDITYVDSSEKLVRRQNVEVLIRTNKDNWFPKVGELITTQETNDNQPIITGQLIRDFIMDVKSNRTYDKDVQATNQSKIRNQMT